MKRTVLILFAAIVLAVFFSSGATAQEPTGYKEFYMYANVVEGDDLIVYAPPDYTTPSLSWTLGGVKRGYYYEISYKIANTSDNVTNRVCEVNGDISDLGVIKFRPESFTLQPGESTFVSVSLTVSANATYEMHALPIRYTEIDD